MINYIIQIVFFQVIFLAVYDLFLKKETFFKWNRLYLLVTPFLSFIIPLLKFESVKNAVSQEYILLLPEVVLNPQVLIEQSSNSEQTYSFITILGLIGIGFFFGLFVIKLSEIINLIVSKKILDKGNYKLILLDGEQTAFSFFNYIFIGKSLYEKEELQIIQHELVHAKQYHTLDLLFFEILKIILWFNPMVYIYQKRITLLHEYISDAEVVKETDERSYFNKLLTETFNAENITFINQFYKHSLIKKRIIMITKTKSKKIRQLKYLLLIPILGSMLFYISCTDNSLNKEINELESIIEDNKVIEDVSFSRIDQVPTFPGCSDENLKECFNQKVRQYVAANFNVKLAEKLNLKGKQKIYVKFKINKEGLIEIEGARAPHKDLEQEARRVVNSLPKMIPGKHGGKVVNVLYVLPITFIVE